MKAATIANKMNDNKVLCMVCGEFMDITEFEISTEVCKWCDVTIRDEV